MSAPPIPSIPTIDPREFRMGVGYDLHRLEAGKKLILGGVAIPFEKGLSGHSDGDILLHALTDALLGAASMGDIGEIFPPSDEQWKDADSSIFLRHARELLQGYGWRIVNVDTIIVIERPKILPYRERIRKNVAGILQIDPDLISIKAKSAEGIGPIGLGQAAEAHAAAAISRAAGPKLM